MKKFFLFFLILLIAVFFRIYKLDAVPPSLNWDEVSHGYNAYSILKTGKDEWGVKYPLIFRAYGDYKLPLYIYLTAIFEAILGLNSFSVRLVSAFSGLGLVILAYLITKNFTQSSLWGFFAAFLTAVSPWSLFVSRVAVEANLGAFLFSLGIFFLFLWFKNNKPWYLVILSFFWGLAMHAYNSARILVPIFYFLSFGFVLKKKKAKQMLLPLGIFIIFFLPVLIQFTNRSASARYEWVSLIDESTIYQIGEKRTHSNLPPLLAKFLFNKTTFFLFYSLQNYLKNLSPLYLFFRGGTHYQFSLPNRELLYLVTAPFLFLGILAVIRKKGIPEKILLSWFFFGFLPSAITKDSPHVLRSLFVLPSPIVLSVLGIKVVVDWFKVRSKLQGKLIVGVIIFAVLISFSRWWKDYWNIYPIGYSWSWQYGYKQAVDFIKENYARYDKIIFTKKYGEPHEFVLFYWPWNPEKYQKEPKNWNYHANWYWVDSFDKFIFVNDWEIGDSANFKVQSLKCDKRIERCLLVTSPGNYPSSEWSRIKTIKFLDGREAFEILEN